MAQNNPYIGPRTFQRNEGHLFFGREREARDLIALVASERLVVFYAQSGAGKSSIVNTRLIPNLETKGYEVLPVARLSGDLAAGDGVDNIYVHNLIRSFEQHDTDSKTFASLTLSDFLAHLNYDDKGFFYDPTPVEADPASDPTEVARRALIIDQFEELFSTYPESWGKREKFFEQLAKAMEDDPQLWVVLVMREDYIAALDPYAHIVSNGLRVRYYMQRLERESALKAVKSPVEGLRPYAEGVAEKLIDDLCSIKVQKPDGTLDVQPGQYAEPVQMQVVCYGLWDNLSDEGTQISEKDLQDVGDVNQSLGKYYDKRVGEVAKAKNVRERLIREWFEKKLITTGGIRNMVLQERDSKPGELPDHVIQALQSDLVRGEKRGGATWYELTHDRLVEPVLERNTIWFAEHLSPLQRQAALWKDQEQNETWLLTGDALHDVQAWAKEHQDELTDTEQDFLEACQKAQKIINEQQAAERNRLEMAQRIAEEQARSAQRARRFNVISGVLVVIAVIASVFAFNQKGIAFNQKGIADATTERARAGELSTTALERAKSQLDLALLLGVMADSFDSNAQTQRTMLTLLQESTSYRGAVQNETDIQDFKYSPDGKHFATLDENGITLWQADTHEKLATINDHYRQVTALTLSSDGKYLASGASDGTIILWDIVNQKKIGEPFSSREGSPILSLTFSPDGKTLVSGLAGDALPVLWDVNNKETVVQKETLINQNQSAAPQEVTIASVAFHPADNHTLATGFSDGSVVLWDLTNRLPYSASPIRINGGQADKIVFNSDGALMVVASSGTSRFILVNTAKAATPQTYNEAEADGPITGIAINQQGTLLVTGNSSGAITLWKISDPANPIKDESALKRGAETGITSLVFNTDGNTLASGYFDGTILLWNTKTHKQISQPAKAITGISSSISALAFAPDQKTLIASSYDSTVSLWDITDPKKPDKISKSLQGHPGQPNWGMEFSSDSSLLASYGEDGVILLDVKSQKSLGVGSFTRSPDNKVLAYQIIDRTSDTGAIQLLNTKTGKPIGSPIASHTPHLPNGEILVYQTFNNDSAQRFHLWDITHQKELTSPSAGEFQALSPDNKILIYQNTEYSTDENGKDTKKAFLNVWDIASGKNLGESVEGSYLVISANTLVFETKATNDDPNPTINLWDFDTQQTIKTFPGKFMGISQDGKILTYAYSNPITGDSSLNIVYTLNGNALINQPIKDGIYHQLSANGNILVYQQTAKGVITLNTQTRKNNKAIPGSFWGYAESGQVLAYSVYDSSSQKYTTVAINTATGQQIGNNINGYLNDLIQDGKVLIYGTSEKKLNVLTLENQNKKEVDGISPSFIKSSPDGKVIIYSTSDNDGVNVRLWDVENNKDIGEPVKGSYRDMNWGTNTLATSSQKDAITFWDTGGNSSFGIVIPDQTDIASAVLSPDGEMLAFANSTNITLQEATNGDTTIVLPNAHAGTIYNASVSPNKKTMLTTGEDNKTYVWSLNPLKQIGDSFTGTNSAISPDGKLLVVGDDQKNTVSLWNLPSGESAGNSFPGSRGTFSPDGRTLAIFNGTDYTTTLWDIASKRQIGSSLRLRGDLMAFSPDGQVLVVSDWNTTTLFNLRTQSIASGKPYAGYFIASPTAAEGFAIVDPASNKTTVLRWTLQEQYDPLSGAEAFFTSTKPHLLVVYDGINNQTTLWNPSNLTKLTYNPLPGRYYACVTGDHKIAGGIDKKNAVVQFIDLDKDLVLSTLKISPQSVDNDVFITFASACETAAVGDYATNTTIVKDLTNSATDKKIPNGYSPRFSPDGEFVAIADYNTRKTTIWRVSNAEQVGSALDGADTTASPENPNILAINNYNYATGSYSTTLWDFKNLTTIAEPQHGNYYTPTFITNDTLALFGNRTVTFWDINKNSPTSAKLPHGHTAQITELLFSPDGKNLASLASDGIVITDLATQNSHTLDNGDYFGQLTDLAFTSNGSRLMAFGRNDGKIYSWDIGNNSISANAPISTPVNKAVNQLVTAVLSPDGKHVAYQLYDGKLNIWNVDTGKSVWDKPLVEIKNYDYTTIAFSPDGSSLFYNDGNKIFLWNAWNNPDRNSKPLELFTSDSNVWRPGLSVLADSNKEARYLTIGDGSRFQLWDLTKKVIVGDPISGSLLASNPEWLIYKDSDQQLIKFALKPEAWANLLCEKAGRNLTRAEWEQYIGDTPEYPSNQAEAPCPDWEIDPASDTSP